MIYTVEGMQSSANYDSKVYFKHQKTCWTENSRPTFTSAQLDDDVHPRGRKDQSQILLNGPGLPAFHNFLNPLKSRGKKRLWFFVYVASMFLCIIQTGERLNYFMQYPVAITFHLERTKAWIYPDVTVCPQHPFESGNILKALRKDCPQTHEGRCGTVHDLLQYDGYKNISQIWQMTGAPIWDEIIECRYGWDVNCKSFEYWWSHLTILGQCYSITIPYEIPFGGPRLGLSILLKDLELPPNHPQDHIRWKVLLHENDSVLEYTSMTRSQMISKYTRTVLMFSKKVYYFEDTPIRPCHPVEQVKKCVAKCFDQKFSRGSKCRLPFMKTSALPLCAASGDFRSLYPVPFMHARVGDVEGCGCGRACQEVSYDIQQDAKRESVPGATRIIVYPIQGDVEIIKERRAYTVNSLFSDIGGALGLYLGACLITFLEIFAYLVKIVKRNISRSPTVSIARPK